MTDYPPPSGGLPPPPPGYPPTAPTPQYPPQQSGYGPPPVQRPPSTPRTWRTWHLLTAAVIALLIGIGIGGAAKKTENVKATASSSAAKTTTTTTTTTEPTTTTTTEPTTTTTTEPTTTTTTAPPQPVDVLTSSGSNKTNTDNFTVSGTWIITVDVNGGAGVIVTIHDAATDASVDHFDFDPGDGQVSQQRRGGTFYLEIAPFGSTYNLVVTDTVG